MKRRHLPGSLKVAAIWIGWIAAITVAHLHINLGAFARPAAGPGGASPLRIGYLPVTCHLTCPVTDFIHKSLKRKGLFQPLRFSGFPELKEAFLSHHTEATFILAPMAMALREQGVPLKIVYLGHRDGTAMVVHKESGIKRIEDLRGRRVAVPNRFSNQRLLLYKALRQRELSIADVNLVEMPPPDMPAALHARSVDAITSGEPFMGQAELDGYGEVLYLTKDVWPNFISCVLAVHQHVIDQRRGDVLELVKGIAQSGMWLDQSTDNRLHAADVVAEQYYNQNPRLLRHVLSKPPDRVRYMRLEPLAPEFEEIKSLGVESGILTGKLRFEDYVDPWFAREAAGVSAHAYVAGKGESGERQQ